MMARRTMVAGLWAPAVMLERLHIENLAIVEDAEIDFGDGLIAVTGETGAGKSIVVGALELVLGGRASQQMIRSGARRAAVEAVFSSPLPPPLGTLLTGELDLEWDGGEPLELRREISASGRSRCFINGQLVSVGDLKRAGELLADIHGQHEHQSLFHLAAQRAALDAYGENENRLSSYRESYQAHAALRQRRAELERLSHDFEKRLDYLNFQLNEIEEANPREGELAELHNEEARLANAEKLASAATQVYELLYEGSDPDGRSVLSSLGEASRSLAEIAALAPELEESVGKGAELEALAEDLALTMRDFAQSSQANPERLEAVIERVETLRRLFRKHGVESESALLEVQGRLTAERDSMQLDERERGEIEEKLAAAFTRMAERADRLHEARVKAARRMAKAVSATLARIGMEKARFEIDVRRSEDHHIDGGDEVEFLLAANVGEGRHPLRQVASGGELSRTMLAIKTALAARDAIPTLLFDEIDAGISGQTAVRVGELMEQLGKSHQVICITHHAPIAARAGRHLSIRKASRKGRTRMIPVALTERDRVEELSRMMGGEAAGAEGKRLARQLLGVKA